MRRTRFVLLSLSILLAGALAAGFAARAVVAPREGEPVNAGVLNVPSVLGQTAEEVLFYPWSTYDALTTLPLSDVLEQERAGFEDAEARMAALSVFYAEMLSPFQTLFGAEYDGEALFLALEEGQSEQLGRPLFLKDFAAPAEGEPLLLSFARSTTGSGGQSISYLVKPAQSEDLTQERQDRALARVTADLESLLRLDEEHWEGNELFMLISQYYDFSSKFGLYDEPLKVLSQTVVSAAESSYFFEFSLIENDAGAENKLVQADLPELPLDQALDRLETVGGGTVQLVSTPQQIVLLFTGPDRSVVGVYYDIQLERYSGIGLSGG